MLIFPKTISPASYWVWRSPSRTRFRLWMSAKRCNAPLYAECIRHRGSRISCKGLASWTRVSRCRQGLRSRDISCSYQMRSRNLLDFLRYSQFSPALEATISAALLLLSIGKLIIESRLALFWRRVIFIGWWMGNGGLSVAFVINGRDIPNRSAHLPHFLSKTQAKTLGYSPQPYLPWVSAANSAGGQEATTHGEDSPAGHRAIK